MCGNGQLSVIQTKVENGWRENIFLTVKANGNFMAGGK